jgi:lipase chaperone LimK
MPTRREQSNHGSAAVNITDQVAQRVIELQRENVKWQSKCKNLAEEKARLKS